jgi:hypothetical protein
MPYEFLLREKARAAIRHVSRTSCSARTAAVSLAPSAAGLFLLTARAIGRAGGVEWQP